MSKTRFFKSLAIQAGFALLLASPNVVRAQSAPTPAPESAPAPVPPPMVHQDPAAQAKALADDFAGFTYTDDQKEQIEKIRQGIGTRKEVVLKDAKLTADQKDAMIVGYTRMEFGSIYRVLSPEQQRQVRQRLRARRAQEQAAKQSKAKKPTS